jgi:TolB-like protein
MVRVSNQHAIEEQVIQEQLRRISSSDEFRKCPRLLRFLQFVVREALSGRDGGSKERLIGMEVFGRPADYDAGADPIVRVEARRLRRKLSEYYARGGREDAMEIRMPKGAYLPTFETKAVSLAERSVAVLPFSGHPLCDGLTARLTALLASSSGLRVVSSTSVFQFKNHARDARRIGEELNVELILEGNVRHAGKRFRCDSQLVSAGDGLHLWAGSFDCANRDAFVVEDEFAGQIARGVCEAFLHETFLQ